MSAPLIDPFQRTINYLRISVTDRCDFRCAYCMSEDMSFLPKSEVLSLEELERLSSTFVRLGVKKLRLTGGEPLVRRDIMHLFRGLSRHLKSGELEELTVTTNGSQLTRFADEMADLGVRRINVSLDTLDPHKFAAITRWGKFDKVMAGLQAAKQAGLKVKINTVALKGVNDDEIDRLISWCGDEGFDLTFIEVMPMGDIGSVERVDQYLPLTQLRAGIEEKWTLNESDHKTGGPARYVEVMETGQKIGFITPMTHNFCESCNRVRLTCTGMLYMCLGQEDAADLRIPLRESDDDAVLEAAIREAITRKPKGHDFIIDRDHKQPAVGRHMSVTGG
ncbi:GTP 3',8-cyclase MoaA [Pelagibius sp. Alg239-R121]|uniref:GTP 3',8-cyclase MoaA n=1 Tax=Pelagibius sp. Alg239-R121 TaxID=2993448 RepID=UPI002AC36001|nr:GTP 3',8-cyclase MoaA [Pelagibius sp. Alg239-R121]